MCPMMQSSTAEKPPCHPREAISSHHDCCMQPDEVAAERQLDQTVRKLAAVPRAAWLVFAAGGATGEPPPMVTQPRSEPLFVLHSSFLT